MLVNAPKELEEIVIPYGVTEIGDGAFKDCTRLASVIIPDYVKKIGNKTFDRCTALINVTVPKSVEYIGTDSFANCTALETVTISGDFETCGNILKGSEDAVLLYGRDCLVKDLPDSYEYSGNRTEWCAISEYIDYCNIDGWCLDPEFDFGEELSDKYFEIDKKYKSSIVSASDREAAYRALARKAGRQLAICVNDLQYCDESAVSVTIPYGVTNINPNVFDGFTGLTSVTIPDSVTKIGVGAFFGCTGLTSVVIPDSVTKVSGSAFEGCTSLTSTNGQQ